MFGTRLLAALVLTTAFAPPPASAAGAEPPPSAAPNEAKIASLVADLSDDAFPTRDDARRKLEVLAAAPATSAAVRKLVEAQLTAKPIELELRDALEAIRRRLPVEEPKTFDVGATTPDAIDAIFQDFESNKFAVREEAAERLRPAALQPATCGLVLQRIKARLDDPALDLESVRRLTPLWHAAWSTWLASPKDAKNPTPPIDDAELARQIERLVAPLPENFTVTHPLVAPSAAAERELLFGLAREDSFPRVRDALEKRLERAVNEGLPPDAFERLQRVFDWSRPAMVAEYWQSGEQKSMQHLLIGVPNQPAGAANASLFDRCDEKFAHCVSGNSLTPGDWPVGVFFPHPSQLNGDSQFHLKNLPTPRRRLSYEYEVPTKISRERQQAIDGARRKQLTRSTCEYLLEQKRALNDHELEMLLYLDPDEISKFAGPYLQSVADVRVPNESPVAFGNGSSHGTFCYKMALIGTAEAGPALAAAIDKQRVLEPTTETPFRMDWIALLSLTERVAWPGCDDWLAEHLDGTEAINMREPSTAKTGASAAALLLRRHNRMPSEFGLERNYFAELIDLENPGYRFTKPDGAAAVKIWWQQYKETERKVAP